MPSNITISSSRIFKLEGLMKYWVESSYNFEDKKKEYKEHLIVAVDYGDETESIASFPMDLKSEITSLLNHINSQ